jgi:hypothetical protein
MTPVPIHPIVVIAITKYQKYHEDGDQDGGVDLDVFFRGAGL